MEKGTLCAWHWFQKIVTAVWISMLHWVIDKNQALRAAYSCLPSKQCSEYIVNHATFLQVAHAQYTHTHPHSHFNYQFTLLYREDIYEMLKSFVSAATRLLTSLSLLSRFHFHFEFWKWHDPFHLCILCDFPTTTKKCIQNNYSIGIFNFFLSNGN